MKPKPLKERFFETYSVGPEPDLNEVKFLDVKSAIKPPESVPVHEGVIAKILERFRRGV